MIALQSPATRNDPVIDSPASHYIHPIPQIHHLYSAPLIQILRGLPWLDILISSLLGGSEVKRKQAFNELSENQVLSPLGTKPEGGYYPSIIVLAHI